MDNNDHALHMFDPVVADEVGVVAAVVFFNIEFWCKFNQETGKNYKDGSWWTYKSTAELSRELHYLSERQIRYSLDRLVEKGFLKRGNFNKKGYDKTKWYAICSDKNDTFVTKNDTFVSKIDGFVGKNDTFVGKNDTFVTPYDKNVVRNDNFVRTSDNFVRPIPDKTTVKTTDKTIISVKESKPKKVTFTPPTLEEIKNYCFEKGLSIDCEYFLDYYTSNGWVVGKNKMKDWRATVRNWARRDSKNKKTETVKSGNEFEDLLREEGYL